jgi:hypothetical protein
MLEVFKGSLKVKGRPLGIRYRLCKRVVGGSNPSGSAYGSRSSVVEHVNGSRFYAFLSL